MVTVNHSVLLGLTLLLTQAEITEEKCSLYESQNCVYMIHASILL